MNYYAYVRDDERDDRDYPCRWCAYFDRGYCGLHNKQVFDDDDACEYFEMADEYLGKTSTEID